MEQSPRKLAPMRVLPILLLMILFSYGPYQSNGQEPKEPSDHTRTEQQEKEHPCPANQTVVIQTHSDAAPNEKHRETKTENATKQSHDWVDKLNAFSTLIIAIFTMGMVVVIGIQIREYRIKERAWVIFAFADEPIVRDIDVRGRAKDFRVIGFLKNVGNTPATVTRKFHFTSAVEKGKSLDLIPPYVQIEEGQTEYQMVPEAVEPALGNITDFEMLNIDKYEIYILGQILYSDAFGRPHETRYCFRYYHEPTTGRQRGFYPEGPPAYLKVT